MRVEAVIRIRRIVLSPHKRRRPSGRTAMLTSTRRGPRI
jgi:hypothetical protein